MLSLLFVGSFLGATIYGEFAQDFKNALQVHKEEFIQNKKKYFDFIDDCICKAEKQLRAIEYCKKCPDPELIKLYVNLIEEYCALLYLQTYLGFDERSMIVIYRRSVESVDNRLYDLLVQMRDSAEVHGLDVDLELDLTKKLIRKVNKSSYEHLSIWDKMRSGFGKAFSGLRLALYEHMV